MTKEAIAAEIKACEERLAALRQQMITQPRLIYFVVRDINTRKIGAIYGGGDSIKIYGQEIWIMLGIEKMTHLRFESISNRYCLGGKDEWNIEWHASTPQIGTI